MPYQHCYPILFCHYSSCRHGIKKPSINQVQNSNNDGYKVIVDLREKRSNIRCFLGMIAKGIVHPS